MPVRARVLSAGRAGASWCSSTGSLSAPPFKHTHTHTRTCTHTHTHTNTRHTHTHTHTQHNTNMHAHARTHTTPARTGADGAPAAAARRARARAALPEGRRGGGRRRHRVWERGGLAQGPIHLLVGGFGRSASSTQFAGRLHLRAAAALRAALARSSRPLHPFVAVAGAEPFDHLRAAPWRSPPPPRAPRSSPPHAPHTAPARRALALPVLNHRTLAPPPPQQTPPPQPRLQTSALHRRRVRHGAL